MRISRGGGKSQAIRISLPVVAQHHIECGRAEGSRVEAARSASEIQDSQGITGIAKETALSSKSGADTPECPVTLVESLQGSQEDHVCGTSE